MRDLQCESKLHLIGQAPRSCTNIFVDWAAPRSSDGLWQQGCRECRGGGVGGGTAPQVATSRNCTSHSHATKLMADQTSWPRGFPDALAGRLYRPTCTQFPLILSESAARRWASKSEIHRVSPSTPQQGKQYFTLINRLVGQKKKSGWLLPTRRRTRTGEKQ
jgi:hypothetical protein